MKASIEDAGGKGSLLDNAGQIFGLWSHFAIAKDHVAFPVKIKEIEFFDEYTSQQGPVDCSCTLIDESEDFLICDMVLNKNNKPWAHIKGWQNRRLGFTKKLWQASLDILNHTLSKEIEPGIFIFENDYKRATAWDFIRKKYLNSPEKKVMDSLSLSKSKQWLMGRVAAKDSVRQLLKANENLTLYPGCITVKNSENGAPFVMGEQVNLPPIEISIAHKNKIAVAMASLKDQAGIDIEEIKDRGEGFISLSLSLIHI